MTLGETLSAQIRKEYIERRGNSPTLKAILDKISNGGGTYVDAHEYAYQAGKILSNIFGKTITVDVLPNGQLDVSNARKIITNALRLNFEDVSQATAEIQRNLNRAAGLGLEPVVPQINEARIKGIAKLSSSAPIDEVIDELKEAITTFSQHVVDDELKANADSHYSAGMRPKIIRRAEAGCCAWCSALAGEHDYPLSNDNVFRRHQRCRCTTEYDPGDGSNKRQNVWKQNEWRDLTNGEMQSRIQSSPQHPEASNEEIESALKRRREYESNWQKASLQETVNKLIKDYVSYYSSDGIKKYYDSRDNSFVVVEDIYGQYFRIYDKTKKGRRTYVGLYGEDLNNTVISGRTVGRSQSEYNAASHFINTDKE